MAKNNGTSVKFEPFEHLIQGFKQDSPRLYEVLKRISNYITALERGDTVVSTPPAPVVIEPLPVTDFLGPVTGFTSAKEVGTRYADKVDRLIHLTVGFVPICPVPQSVTYLISSDNGANWVWIGSQRMLQVGQELKVDRLAIPDDAQWMVAAVGGNVGGDPRPITNAALPLLYPGVVKSLPFLVKGYSKPLEDQGITATIGECTNVATADNFTQYGRIPGVIYTDPPNSIDKAVKITVTDLNSSYVPISAEKPHSNVGITGPGDTHTIGELLVTYTPGLAYIQYKFYVANRIGDDKDFTDPETNTLQLVSFNGQPPTHNYEVTISIPPFTPPSTTGYNVLSVTGRECGPKYQDENSGLHTVIALAPVLDIDFSQPRDVTFWVDYGNGVPVWNNVYAMTYEGQEIKIGEQTLGADGTRNSGTIWVPVNKDLGNWRVWCGAGKLEKGIDPSGYPNSGFVVIPIQPCSPTAITNCLFIPNPDTGDLIDYSLYDPGIWYWEYYTLQWHPPTLDAEPDFWFSEITVQKGATIGGVWTPASDYEGRNTDPYGSFLGRLHDEVHTPAGLKNDQTVILEKHGAHPATWDIPPAHLSDLSTVNPFREYRFLMYAVSRLGIDASGSGADRTHTLQTSCWPGGKSFYILSPVAKNGDLNLKLANPESITGPLTGGGGQPLDVKPGGITGTYIDDDAILARHMHEDSITAANKALAANSIVDLNVIDVGVAKLISGTNIFTGDVILSRGTSKPVIILQNSGINLFGVSDATVGSGGLTSQPNVAIQSGGISLFAGATSKSVTVTPSAITFWSVNGSVNNPYVTVGSAGIVLSDGATPTPQTFSLDNTGFTIADKSGAKITVKAGVIGLTTPLVTPAGAFANAVMDGNGLKFTSGQGATLMTLKMDSGGIAITQGTASVTITNNQVNIVNGSLNIISGTVTINIDYSNYVKVADTATGRTAQLNGSFVTIWETAIPNNSTSLFPPGMVVASGNNSVFGNFGSTGITLSTGQAPGQVTQFTLDKDKIRFVTGATVNAEFNRTQVVFATNRVLTTRMPGPGFPGAFTDLGIVRTWCIGLYEALCSATSGNGNGNAGGGHGLIV